MPKILNQKQYLHNTAKIFEINHEPDNIDVRFVDTFNTIAMEYSNQEITKDVVVIKHRSGILSKTEL